MTLRTFYRIDEPEQIDALLTGIAFQCPLGGNPADCVIADIREMSIHERLASLAALTPEQKRSLYLQHLACLQDRESHSFG